MSWAPRYGLKGMIDASVKFTIESNTSEVMEKIMPLEFKSGRVFNGQASSQPFQFIQFSDVVHIAILGGLAFLGTTF